MHRTLMRLLCALLGASAVLVLSSFSSLATPQSPPISSVQVHQNVIYGEAGGVKLLMDVYLPKAFPGKRPGVLLVHGGGWVGGDKAAYVNIGKALAAHGYDAFSVNYRLAPRFHYPAQLDDVQRAVRFIRAHAADYNLDPARIGALGDSAGGYLVAFLGLRDTRDNSDPSLANYSSKVECVVDFYGPTDFTIPLQLAHINNLVTNLLTMYFGKKPGEDASLYRDGSPIAFVSKEAPPFLILQGTTDNLVPPDQSERLYDALHKAGNDVTLLLAYNMPHGFLNFVKPDLYFDISVQFLDRVLKPSTP